MFMRRNLLVVALLPLSLSDFGLGPIPTRAFDPKIDNPARLAPQTALERNMLHIAEVKTAEASGKPWSDRQWDHNMALLGERYTDDNFRQVRGWPARRQYISRYSAEAALSLSPRDPVQRSWIAALSPAEKYDLIMGTIRGGLYDQMAASLDRDMDATGRFPGWWGICEGSAAAALAEPEPTKDIVVHSEAYNVDVPFYAADVKGLVSMLWSSYNKSLHLPEMGQQCQGALGDKTPACFDVNPGSLMIALHHFIGRGNGNLILDTDASRVVWNHPVIGYQMRFYRPGVPDTETNFQGGLRKAGDGQDPRDRSRAPNTAYLLGVRMDLDYGENVKPTPKNGVVPRKVKTMNLVFELELDSAFNILGGEWISKRHPDLLWTIPRGFKPDSAGDASLGDARWDGVSAPADWAQAAYRSAGNSVPLRHIVDGLVRRSAGRGPGAE